MSRARDLSAVLPTMLGELSLTHKHLNISVHGGVPTFFVTPIFAAATMSRVQARPREAVDTSGIPRKTRFASTLLGKSCF